MRTGRIAASFALFNIIVLVSRTANSFYSPLLAKRVEHVLVEGVVLGVEDFRVLLWAGAIATIVGAVLIPSFYRLFSRAVEVFDARRSLLFLFARGITRRGGRVLVPQLRVPRAKQLRMFLTTRPVLPFRILVANMVVIALWACGVLSAIYAGFLNPELRATASHLASIVHGVGTILLFAIVDPYVSAMTDDAARGKLDETCFQNAVAWLVASRFVGTLLAQLVLVPSAHVIASVANLL